VLRWILLAALAIIALVGVVAAVGLLLPKGHRASRTVVYPAAPEVVFAAITDFARFPDWRKDVKKVELLPDDGRGQRFREDGKNGVIAYRVELREPNRKLVTRIDDPSLPFGGTWMFELTPAPEGTSLTITEDGEIYNPIFRTLSKVVFSPSATIDTYQADLRTRLTAGRQ
jgi:uncharacterized protein YndB with AHSA1/START domain